MLEQALWKILAFIMAVILIFVAPTVTVYDRMDAITYNVVETELSRFCDGIRDTGQLSEPVYNAFLAELAKTGVNYEVKLEHHEKVYLPKTVSGGDPSYEIVYEPFTDYDFEMTFQLGDIYQMSVGDLFYVHVKNISPTKGQTVRQLLLGGGSEYPIIVARNGGMIRHEPD